MLLLYYASEFSLSVMDFLASSYFGTVSFGLSRKFIFLCPKCWNITKFICNNTYDVSICVLDICLFFIYLFIFVKIVTKLFIRKKKFNHVNDWLTRPLMERYRSNLERRRTQQRPPFIQAFRSHQPSAPGSFFNQFVTEIYIYIYNHRVLIVRIMPPDQ